MATLHSPRVSFVVPCYNLAHLLGECVGSILDQTYQDVEVLILDDCSPDNTPEVARSFGDPRVRHIRNEKNLRHLANYNKGISLSRGEYVWLISADDKLRSRNVLERFVSFLDAHPDAGYVFCPVLRFQAERDTTLYGSHGSVDSVFRGREFLRTLLHGNGVPAASGLVRKTFYDRFGAFPLDLPFAGDWYMWCLFALHGDVGYLAEPMVGWRDHEQNMTKFFKERATLLVRDEFEVLWRVRDLIAAEGDDALLAECTEALASYYAFRVVPRLREEETIGLTIEDFEDSLESHAKESGVKDRIRAAVYEAVADSYYESKNFAAAASYYGKSLARRPASVRTRLKRWLVATRGAGWRLHRALRREPQPRVEVSR